MCAVLSSSWKRGSLFVLALASVLLPASLKGDEAADARAIFDATGIRGGLVVHLGSGDGKLTAALRSGPGYQVHGLDTDGEKVAAARRYIQSLGIYGEVSVDRFTGTRLPYIDNLVNLLVGEDLAGVSMEEALRVLVPRGVVYTKVAGEW